MRYFLTITLICIGSKLLACSCITLGDVIARVTSSEFVALAKIKKVYPVSDDAKYDSVEIEPVEIYKGKHTTTLKIPDRRTSCAMGVEEGDTWLIYAYRDGPGALAFHYCSGSMQARYAGDTIRYPDAGKNFREDMAFRLRFLAYIRDHKMEPVNTYGLFAMLQNTAGLADLKEKDFAIYKLRIGKDLSVEKVEAVRPFSRVPDEEIKKRFLSGSRMYRYSNDRTIPEATWIMVGLVYLNSDGGRTYVGTFR